MPSEIRILYTKIEKQQDQVDAWLRTCAGVGLVRYGGREGEIRHWLNGDDWLYYNCYTLGDSDQLGNQDTVFIFRDEKIATEFSLRFA